MKVYTLYDCSGEVLGFFLADDLSRAQPVWDELKLSNVASSPVTNQEGIYGITAKNENGAPTNYSVRESVYSPNQIIRVK